MTRERHEIDGQTDPELTFQNKSVELSTGNLKRNVYFKAQTLSCLA